MQVETLIKSPLPFNNGKIKLTFLYFVILVLLVNNASGGVEHHGVPQVPPMTPWLALHRDHSTLNDELTLQKLFKLTNKLSHHNFITVTKN